MELEYKQQRNSVIFVEVAGKSKIYLVTLYIVAKNEF